jgi:hypothetical protein
MAELAMEAFEAARAAERQDLNSEVCGGLRLSQYVLSYKDEKAYKASQEYKEYREHQHTVRIKKYAPAFIFGFFSFVLERKPLVGFFDHKGKAKGTYNEADKLQEKNRRETSPCGNQQGLVRCGLQGNQGVNKGKRKPEGAGSQGYQPLVGQAVRSLLGFYELVRIAFIGLIELPVMIRGDSIRFFHTKNILLAAEEIKNPARGYYSGFRLGSSGFALGGRPPLSTTFMTSITEGSYRALYETGLMPALVSLLCAVLGVIFSVSAISSMVMPFMLPLSEKFGKKMEYFKKILSIHIDKYKICRYI